jgi:thiosulfate/3-mercaptopyruvate sulfurtransferase
MRPAARFAGEQPEVRPGLACGHMPFSKNLPFSKLIDSTTGEMVSVTINFLFL